METFSGTVKWFNNKKGYGFITSSDGKDYFVHYSGIKGDGFKRLENGQSVTFCLKDSDKGPEAIEVEAVA